MKLSVCTQKFLHMRYENTLSMEMSETFSLDMRNFEQ